MSEADVPSINGCDMTRSDSAPDLGCQLRAGDEAVLEAILRIHGPPILTLLKQRFVGRLTGNDLEDVLASALFRLWQHRSRFDPALASLRVWFFRISENLARDVLKHGWHKARQLESNLEPAVLAMLLDRRPTTNDVDSARNGHVAPKLRIPIEELREVLALLPDSQRRIVLADADSPDGLVASQFLANELGITPATVRVYRRRALERLKREIEQRELAGQLSPTEASSS